MAAKPWIIGELNPYGPDAEFAMYPLPTNSAGGRLCSLILGMRRVDYLREFERRNLCVGKWSIRAARAAASEILEQTEPQRAPLILLGSKVCAGFGVPFTPWPVDRWVVNQCPVTVLPHPSGLCRLWHEPRAIERARESVLQIAPHLSEFLGRHAA